MNKIAKYFFSGLLFLVPVSITAYIFVKAFLFFDGLLKPLIKLSLNRDLPGLGILITLILVTVMGYLTSNFITKSFFGYFDTMLNRLPVVSFVYSTIKDVIGAFVGDKKSFDKPVAVRLFHESNVKALGFITKDSLEHFGMDDCVAVYLPQSYNFAGSVLIFPKDQVDVLEADSAEVMAFIVSAGITGKK
jgi:uncharacterized membrane protein